MNCGVGLGRWGDVILDSYLAIVSLPYYSFVYSYYYTIPIETEERV